MNSIDKETWLENHGTLTYSNNEYEPPSIQWTSDSGGYVDASYRMELDDIFDNLVESIWNTMLWIERK